MIALQTVPYCVSLLIDDPVSHPREEQYSESSRSVALSLLDLVAHDHRDLLEKTLLVDSHLDYHFT